MMFLFLEKPPPTSVVIFPLTFPAGRDASGGRDAQSLPSLLGGAAPRRSLDTWKRFTQVN